MVFTPFSRFLIGNEELGVRDISHSNAVHIQVPCRNVGVLAEIYFIIGIYFMYEQGESEYILASVIEGNIEFWLVTSESIYTARESLKFRSLDINFYI